MAFSDPARENRTETTIVADGHVHVHDCFDRATFFEAAARRLGGVQLPLSGPRVCVLMLTEGADEHFFDACRDVLEKGGEGSLFADGCPFGLHTTDEPHALRLADNARTLFLVAGCQVATTDGLEVLMLATDRRVPDRLPIHETLEQALAMGALCVIPWGAGKWWGSRGRLLLDLTAEYGGHGLFLGDESGRPWFWPRPALLDRAVSQGVRNLPGTDPLPFPGEAHKVGRMGFALRAPWDPRRPAASVVEALAADRKQPFLFADLESTVPFFINQFRMQLRKHRG